MSATVHELLALDCHLADAEEARDLAHARLESCTDLRWGPVLRGALTEAEDRVQALRARRHAFVASELAVPHLKVVAGG